jgi:hypothetical protein
MRGSNIADFQMCNQESTGIVKTKSACLNKHFLQRWVMRWGHTNMRVNSGRLCHKKLSCSMAMLPSAGGGSHRKASLLESAACGHHNPSKFLEPPSRLWPAKSQSDSSKSLRENIVGAHHWHHGMTPAERMQGGRCKGTWCVGSRRKGDPRDKPSVSCACRNVDDMKPELVRKLKLLQSEN